MSENLWSFATRIYAGPGVAAHCLGWQEQFGADVDVLLTGLWLASRQNVWSATSVAEIKRHCAVWRDNGVLPLRSTRRALAQSDLYTLLKQAELSAERTQLDMIARWLDRHATAAVDVSPSVCAERNLTCYAQQLDIPPETVAIQTLVLSCAPLLKSTLIE